MVLSIPSAEEYEANRPQGDAFTLLPEDDYIVEIKEINIKKDQVDIFNKNEDGTPVIRDTLEVRLRPISFVNGDDLVDENGDEVGSDRLFFAWIDPTHVGLVPQPAKARKFFAAALGTNVEDRIDIDDYADLLGKRVVVTMTHNKGKHKIVDFRKVSRRGPGRPKKEDAEVAVSAASKLSDTDATKVQKAAEEIFTDDLPF